MATLLTLQRFNPLASRFGKSLLVVSLCALAAPAVWAGLVKPRKNTEELLQQMGRDSVAAMFQVQKAETFVLEGEKEFARLSVLVVEDLYNTKKGQTVEVVFRLGTSASPAAPPKVGERAVIFGFKNSEIGERFGSGAYTLNFASLFDMVENKQKEWIVLGKGAGHGIATNAKIGDLRNRLAADVAALNKTDWK